MGENNFEKRDLSDEIYMEKLGALFEKKRADYVSFAESLIIAKAAFPETDRLEVAKDMVQKAFVALIANRNIDFTLPEESIESYAASAVKMQTLNWVKQYYGNESQNFERIPENAYVPIDEAFQKTSPDSDPLDLVENEIFKKSVNEILSTQSPRKERVFKMLYGLEPYKKQHTLKEITAAEGLPPGQIITIRNNILKEMRSRNH